MAVDILTGRKSGRDWSVSIDGFGESAREAITRNPDYFVWWYTAKSIGLGVAVGLIGFFAGQASCKKKH